MFWSFFYNLTWNITFLRTPSQRPNNNASRLWCLSSAPMMPFFRARRDDPWGVPIAHPSVMMPIQSALSSSPEPQNTLLSPSFIIYTYARAYTSFYPHFHPIPKTPHLCPKNEKIVLCANTILDICQENARFFEKHIKIIVGSEKSPYLCSVKRKKWPQTVGHETTQARDLFLGNNKY